MGLFDNTPLPLTPNPEPPGFDLLRDIIMRRIFQNQANPYGQSGGGNPASQFSTGVMGGRLGGMPMSQYSGNGGGAPMGGGMGGGRPMPMSLPPRPTGQNQMGQGGGQPNIQMLLQAIMASRGQRQQPMGGGQLGGMQQVIGHDAPVFPWTPQGIPQQQAPQGPGPVSPPQQRPPGGAGTLGGQNGGGTGTFGGGSTPGGGPGGGGTLGGGVMPAPNFPPQMQQQGRPALYAQKMNPFPTPISPPTQAPQLNPWGSPGWQPPTQAPQFNPWGQGGWQPGQGF